MWSHRLSRTTRGALAATAVATVVALVPFPASADPALPPDAPAAVQRLAELSHEAEQLTEDWHAANDALGAARVALDTARADGAAATTAGDLARSRQQQFRGQVDVLTGATFEGARLNQLSALLVSDDPQEFLDQMSALDLLATDNNAALQELAAAVTEAEAAERSAADAQTRAIEAEAAAAVVEGDLARAREDMDRQIGLVEDHIDTLTAEERAIATAPDDGAPGDAPAAAPATDDTSDEDSGDAPVAVGSGSGGAALQAAMTKEGSAYSWGAEGPGSFDCSGLVQWAYSQVGVDLPRSSREQARVGTAVTRDQLQPGDLIALDGHIGLFVGGDTYYDAPTYGQTVGRSTIPWGQVVAMRRVG